MGRSTARQSYLDKDVVQKLIVPCSCELGGLTEQNRILLHHEDKEPWKYVYVIAVTVLDIFSLCIPKYMIQQRGGW